MGYTIINQVGVVTRMERVIILCQGVVLPRLIRTLGWVLHYPQSVHLAIKLTRVD